MDITDEEYFNLVGSITEVRKKSAYTLELMCFSAKLEVIFLTLEDLAKDGMSLKEESSGLDLKVDNTLLDDLWDDAMKILDTKQRQQLKIFNTILKGE